MALLEDWVTQRTRKKRSTADSIPPVFSVRYRGIAVLSVSARDLHSALHLNNGWMSWTHSRIQKSRLLDSREYFPARIRISQGQWLEDYYLPLSTAKSLCMLEGSGVAVFVRRGLIEMEQKLVNKSTPTVRLRKVGCDAILANRVWYWTIHKLEMMLANGASFEPGRLHQLAISINGQIEEDIERALRGEFSHEKYNSIDRSDFIEQWKPEFAKLLPGEFSE